MPRGRPTPFAARIEPLGDAVWPERVECVLAALDALGPTPTHELVRALARAERWPHDLARHALAAAHPAALEAAGVWFLAGDARERPVAPGSMRPGSVRDEALGLGVSPHTVRYRREREEAVSMWLPIGTRRCSGCGQRGEVWRRAVWWSGVAERCGRRRGSHHRRAVRGVPHRRRAPRLAAVQRSRRPAAPDPGVAPVRDAVVRAEVAPLNCEYE
mgnify:CR=1 FL=1